MKNIIYIMLIISFLFLAACGTSPAMAEVPSTPPETAAPTYDYHYVSLGDSIAWGYGLENIESECFCYRLGDLLAESVGNVEVFRDGVNGNTSTDLTELLETGGADGLAEADLITISIGANNILQPAVAFLRDYAAYNEGASSLTSDAVTTSFASFLEQADAGVEAMRNDIPIIIEQIRDMNPDAQIVWLTVYNPYRGTDANFTIGGIPIQFEALSQTKIGLLNEVIQDGAQEYGYSVADVDAAFEADGGVLVNAAEGTELFSFLLDPHPNAAGHRIIAETILNVLD